ncbi:hypothetical protein Efla_000129 [Eimeria flavescens]
MVFLKARQLPAAGERIYPHDGNPEISNLTNRQGFSLTAYCWRVQQPRAAALFIHGVQSHARFEFLRHLQPDEADIEAPPSAGASSASSCKQYTRWCIYKGSWIEQLNVAGCSVYAGDMQSFGLSAGWKGRRCSVERLDHLASDVICFAEFAASDLAKQAQTENASPSPLFLVGISMGGFAVIRALELMGQENHWLLPRPLPSSPPFPSPPAAAPAAADAAAADAAAAGNSSSKEGEKKKPQLAGCVALCPMLSVEKASAGFSNKAAAKVGCVLSRLAPHLRVVKLPAARLAWIDQQKNELIKEVYIPFDADAQREEKKKIRK